ncbi:hypothetical protein BC828DRAFT_163634 [Blastocladiella britannica]|nr:hypothetical protein BC828DRAFT_163634 [Blastocladiella britannica]
MIPSLVLDRIFCHLIGGTKAEKPCPDDWSACLMAASPAVVPDFIRSLLRQCKSFSALKDDDTPSLPLLQAWFSSFTPCGLALADAGALLVSTIRRSDLDAFEWLCECCANKQNNLPLVVTADMVDAASKAGVLMLDRLWHLHCDRLHLQPIEFPSTIKAIDDAQDVATLDWWWQKHTQFGLPFEYLEAVHRAFTGSVSSDVVYPKSSGTRQLPPTIVEDRPTQLAMCQWWRDRATVDGLELSIQIVDTDDPAGSDDENEHDVLRPFNIADLVELAVWDRIDLLETWAAMVDSTLLPAVSMDLVRFHFDSLEEFELFDPRVLDWWWQQHVQHELPFPDVQELLATASYHARIDTLDWIWHKSALHTADSSPNPLPFVVLEEIRVSQKAMTTTVPWWFACIKADPKLKMPELVWDSNDDDTLEDMQAFWDLQFDPSLSGSKIQLPYYYYPTDIRLIPWMKERQSNEGSDYDFWYTFERLWKKRRIADMDKLLTCHFEDQKENDSHRPRSCIIEAIRANDQTLAQWWYSRPELRAKLGARDVDFMLRVALGANQCRSAAWVAYMARDLGIDLPLAEMLDWLCIYAHNKPASVSVPALEWIAERNRHDGGSHIQPSAEAFKKLIFSADQDGSSRVIEWLAMHGPSRGILVPVLTDSKLQDLWEVLQRAARLGMPTMVSLELVLGNDAALACK